MPAKLPAVTALSNLVLSLVAKPAEGQQQLATVTQLAPPQLPQGLYYDPGAQRKKALYGALNTT